MTNWHFRIRGLGHLAAELAIGLLSVGLVIAFAKYGL
jgi:hypothetical protein